MKFIRISMMTILLSLVLLAGCGKNDKSTEEGTTSIEQNDEIDDVTCDGMVKDVLSQMSLEEKIGQLFIVCTDSLDFYAETSVTDEMKENLQTYQPGGIVFYSFNLESRDQVTTFIEDMQAEVKIPMFMSVDEEGGPVSRIANHENMGTTQFPSMKEIGETEDVTKAYEVGSVIGKEISELGFNLDFAPVADVISSEENTEIGERSFGSDPELVSSMVKEVVKGLQSNNVSATLKHFPGQGSSTEDTHKGFSDMDLTIDELRGVDLIPFTEGIKAGVDFIMVSHVALSTVTGDDLPSSLSSIVVTDILRNELQFDNVIITDGMNMKSITKFFDSDEAAVKAFQAGNDMILMPDDFTSAVGGILEAVDSGKISEDDIDDAVRRILRIKIRRGILTQDSEYFS